MTETEPTSHYIQTIQMGDPNLTGVEADHWLSHIAYICMYPRGPCYYRPEALHYMYMYSHFAYGQNSAPEHRVCVWIDPAAENTRPAPSPTCSLRGFTVHMYTVGRNAILSKCGKGSTLAFVLTSTILCRVHAISCIRPRPNGMQFSSADTSESDIHAPITL